MIYIDAIGNNSSAVLTFEQKVDFFKRYLTSKENWQKLAQSLKTTSAGDARVQALSVFKKISEDRSIKENRPAQDIFKEMIRTLDEHLSQVQ